MKVLELIPSNILTKILAKEPLEFHPFEKYFYSSILNVELKTLFNNFTKLNEGDFEIEIELLNTYDCFKVTKDDKECVAYGLKPFNFDETFAMIQQLEIINVISMFLVIRSIYSSYKEKLSKNKRLQTVQLMRILQRESRIFKEICYGKGLKDYYDNLVDPTVNDLKYLEEYMEAIKA